MPLDEQGLWQPAESSFAALRSCRYGAPAVASGRRAVSAGLRTPRVDAHGRPYMGRGVRLLGGGVHDAREAERLLLDAAAEEGVSHDEIELETKPWLETEIQSSQGPS